MESSNDLTSVGANGRGRSELERLREENARLHAESTQKDLVIAAQAERIEHLNGRLEQAQCCGLTGLRNYDAYHDERLRIIRAALEHPFGERLLRGPIGPVSNPSIWIPVLHVPEMSDADIQAVDPTALAIKMQIAEERDDFLRTRLVTNVRMDLDGLGLANERGHDRGDLYIIAWTLFLKLALKEFGRDDALYRLTRGDEVGLFLEGMVREDAKAITAATKDLMQEPFPEEIAAELARRTHLPIGKILGKCLKDFIWFQADFADGATDTLETLDEMGKALKGRRPLSDENRATRAWQFYNWLADWRQIVDKAPNRIFYLIHTYRNDPEAFERANEALMKGAYVGRRAVLELARSSSDPHTLYEKARKLVADRLKRESIDATTRLERIARMIVLKEAFPEYA